MPEVNPNPGVEKHILKDDGTFPNNATLPLLIYKKALDVSHGDGASMMEEIFHEHQWGNDWRNGIYPYHHYHSVAHEVLGIYQGQAQVQLGGPEGITATVQAGDMIIIPAGVAHKKLDASADFACVGAYPPGQNFDMNYGKEGERPEVDENIAQVPVPDTDPVYGKDGPLKEHWK